MEYFNLKLFLAPQSAAEPNLAPGFEMILGFYWNTNPFLYQPNPQNGFAGAQAWFLQLGRNNWAMTAKRQLQVTPGAPPQLFRDGNPGKWAHLCCFQDGILKFPVGFPQGRALGHMQPHSCQSPLEDGPDLLDASFLTNASNGILGIFQPNFRT